MQPDAFRASLLRRECFLGIDLSDQIDLSAVVAIFPRPLIREGEAAGSQAAVERQAATAPTDRPTIDHALDVLPFFWMPAKTLTKRANEDKIPYPDWARDGYVFTTPGSQIDHDAIVDFILGMATRYQIRGIGIDQACASAVVTRLQRHFGHDDTVPAEERFVWPVPQGFRRLSAPSKILEALIVGGNLTHDGNPCLAWCMSNLATEENAWREIRPVKLSQRKRIDGGVALIDAIAKMTATPAAQRSVYLTRGVRTLGT